MIPFRKSREWEKLSKSTKKRGFPMSQLLPLGQFCELVGKEVTSWDTTAEVFIMLSIQLAADFWAASPSPKPKPEESKGLLAQR